MKTSVVISFHVDSEEAERGALALQDDLFDGDLEPGSYEVRFQRGEDGLSDIIDLLQRMELPYTITEERMFRRRELEGAGALHMSPTQRVPIPEREGAFESGQCCPVCGRTEDEDCELIVAGDMSEAPCLTVAPSGHLLVNEEMAKDLISERISGCLLRNVHNEWGPAEGVYQLLPTHTLPAMQTPPTRLVQHPESECPVCETGGLGLNSMLYYDAPLKEFKDVNFSSECFGDGPSIWQEIVISQRMFRMLVEHGAAGFQVEPVILV